MCNGLYFRGRDVLCWPGIGGEAPDTGYLSECRIFKGDVTGRLPIEGVVSLLVNVSAANGVAAITEQGFAALTDQELWRRVAGNTLRLAGSLGYFSDDRSVELASTALGSGLTSSGTWKIKKMNVCHSIRDGHEFCTGLYFRGEEVLCWPGIGRYAPDTGYLRECRVLPGKGAI